MSATQTGSAISSAAWAIWVQTAAGTAWTAICGEATNVAFTGGDMPTGQMFTACGAGPVITRSNKRNPYNVTITAVYTEVADTEAFDLVRDRFNSGTPTLGVRMAPAGTATGSKAFCTSNSGTAAELVPIISCPPPDLDAQSNDPLTFQFVVLSPTLFDTTLS